MPDHQILIEVKPEKPLAELLIKARTEGYRWLLVTETPPVPADRDTLENLLGKPGDEDPAVVFSRQQANGNVPGDKLFLCKFSRLMIRAEAELKLSDPHSPNVCWPVNSAIKIKPLFHRQEGLERMVHLALKGIPVIEIPWSGEILADPERKRPGLLYLNSLHLSLSLVSILWLRPLGWFRRFRKKNIRQALSHLFGMEDPPLKKAISLAFGLFMGILPIYGFQMVITIPAAIFLRMNKPLVILGVQISSPPFIPLLVFLGIRIGGFLLREPFPVMTLAETTLKSIGLAARQFVLGSVVLALAVAIVTGILSALIFTLISRRKKNA